MNVRLSAARKAGLAYLALAISGILGFMVIRGRLVEHGDAAATTANLIAHPSLARAGLAAMVTVVASQSLAAIYFFTDALVLPAIVGELWMVAHLLIRNGPSPGLDRHAAEGAVPA